MLDSECPQSLLPWEVVGCGGGDLGNFKILKAGGPGDMTHKSQEEEVVTFGATRHPLLLSSPSF